MRTDEPRPVRLAEYRPPDFQIDDIGLSVQLDKDRTVVTARSRVRRTGGLDAPLRLDGEALELLSCKINGRAVAKKRLSVEPGSLTITDAPNEFTLEIETAFSPRENSALSGIYLSNERIFSQCEAEGFRRITYFLDRPDVLAKYSVRIEGDAADFPTMLSNGNLEASGELDNGRHYAVWRDPFPKPAYLFALVAGEFDKIEDAFVTMSGKTVPLVIYVDPGDGPRAEWALDSLKRAMLWDEKAFGREYDLDLFMIVAVRDFNFGAMENKGLNIFNSSVLLADEETATDGDFELIESVVAHEYFHNWTGNRITCRDWFQLCLKEGLTVFRDQEFSAHERGEALARIKDVKMLRARQFPEDAGPLAHAVRPDSYIKIDNFYTATVYEKGSELIRMLKTMVGEDGFRTGMDRYFEQFDGTAATIEEFLSCFAAEAGPRIFGMLRWYEQAGTPRVELTATHDKKTETLTITARQTLDPTPGQPVKRPAPIPLRIGLVGEDGADTPLRLDGETMRDVPSERILVLEAPEQSWRFSQVGGATPVVSALRGFSAPVCLKMEEPANARTRRAAFDSDTFNRWEACHSLVRDAIVAAASGDEGNTAETLQSSAIDVFAAILSDEALDPGFKALAVSPPDEMELAQHVDIVDPEAIAHARGAFMKAAGEKLDEKFAGIRDALPADKKYSPDAESASRRALRNVALRYLAERGPEKGGALALAQLKSATNLTDRLAALGALDASGSDKLDDALSELYAAWKSRPLLIDKWFAMQARSGRADALDRVRKLLNHPDYDPRTPNRARALTGVFAMGNPRAFHAADGAGYELFLDQVLAIDKKNPALSARLLGAFEIWPRLEAKRKKLARETLMKARDADGASRNLFEIASKSLNAKAD